MSYWRRGERYSDVSFKIIITAELDIDIQYDGFLECFQTKHFTCFYCETSNTDNLGDASACKEILNHNFVINILVEYGSINMYDNVNQKLIFLSDRF